MVKESSPLKSLIIVWFTIAIVLCKCRNMVSEDVGSVLFFYDSLKIDARESQRGLDTNKLFLFHLANMSVLVLNGMQKTDGQKIP